MTTSSGTTLEILHDRAALRDLVDAYADCADRRDAAGQMALFTQDTAFLVFMNAKSDEPTQTVKGRDALAPIFENLNRYETTTHFNGQSTVHVSGDTATGLTYCLAHHVTDDAGSRSLMIASIRYLDHMQKQHGEWKFAERRLYVDWIETRPLT